MSIQRLKRLQRLESRRRSDTPWFDPFEVAQALLQRIEVDAAAVRAGRAEWIPVYGPPTEKEDTAFRLRMKELDDIAERLRAPAPL